jgi:lactoylglutathione lyase
MRIDHVLICTRDLPTMQRFFAEVLRLKPGKRPPFPFDGVWLYSEGRPIIHLAASSNHGNKGAIDHIAFTGDKYKSLIHRLTRHNHDYVERTVPDSGEHQVFVTGPEGISLEIQFPSGTVV